MNITYKDPHDFDRDVLQDLFLSVGVAIEGASVLSRSRFIFSPAIPSSPLDKP